LFLRGKRVVDNVRQYPRRRLTDNRREARMLRIAPPLNPGVREGTREREEDRQDWKQPTWAHRRRTPAAKEDTVRCGLSGECAGDWAGRTGTALAASFADQVNRLIRAEGNSLALWLARARHVSPKRFAGLSCDEVAGAKEPQAAVRTNRDP